MTPEHNHLGQPVGMPMPEWRSVPFPEGTALTGRYCQLERVNVDQHGQDLYETLYASTDQQEWTYLLHEPASDAEDFIHWLQTISRSQDPMFYAIIDSHTGQAVGLASYLRINPQHGVIEVGHLHFSPVLQKTAAATEAMGCN
ncbi:GNAT family N-acetyltransferase [Endozoicomonas lisbonensis]|uniref:RimJ/RimL family protein N-acetyltransferase n=1 Tax=Endozoicomonas lisbonensis TaxID=3120522 RepID=A0ABV2SM85_9GAMM